MTVAGDSKNKSPDDFPTPASLGIYHFRTSAIVVPYAGAGDCPTAFASLTESLTVGNADHQANGTKLKSLLHRGIGEMEIQKVFDLCVNWLKTHDMISQSKGAAWVAPL
jgi:hypothetical protein